MCTKERETQLCLNLHQAPSTKLLEREDADEGDTKEDHVDGVKDGGYYALCIICHFSCALVDGM